MLQRFQRHIDLTFPFLEGRKLIVAVSGGVDSVALAHLLHRLKFSITLAHCNFKLRGAESDEDENFTLGFGKKLAVTVHTKDFDTEAYAESRKISIQMAARELRYQWFALLLGDSAYDYGLTAHHADDDLETFLINLSRGTGLEGLTGIPEQNQRIIRPLLPFSRAELLDYARKNKLLWREDSSNAATRYLRNNIRHNIVPELKKLNPAFSANFRKTLQYLSGSRHILDRHIAAQKKTLFQKENNVFKISVAKLAALSPQKPYVYELFKAFGFTEWNNVAYMLRAPSGKQLFSATHRLLKDRDYIYIEALSEKTGAAQVVIDENTRSIAVPVKLTIAEVEGIADTASDTLYVDKEKLKFPLVVRKWKKGDYFYPFGMQGRKKISKYFKDEKYALTDKERQWLLCNNSGDIVWIIGRRADNRYRVDHSSRNILKIKVRQ